MAEAKGNNHRPGFGISNFVFMVLKLVCGGNILLSKKIANYSIKKFHPGA